MKDWGKEEMKSFLVTITYNTLLNHAKTAFLLTAFFPLGMLCAYGKLLLLAHKTIFILIIYLSFGIIFIMAHMASLNWSLKLCRFIYTFNNVKIATYQTNIYS